MHIDALFDAALEELRHETPGSPVPLLVELHRRGTREIYERAVAWTRSRSELERVLAVRILRELGGSPPRFATEALPLLVRMLDEETSRLVLRWVVSAIGYQRVHDARALAAVIEHAKHEDGAVRFAVAAALPALVNELVPEREAIDALICLASDADADTRYYALVGLIDDLGLARDPSVMHALERLANDADEQIRSTARRFADSR